MRANLFSQYRQAYGLSPVGIIKKMIFPIFQQKLVIFDNFSNLFEFEERLKDYDFLPYFGHWLIANEHRQPIDLLQVTQDFQNDNS